MILHQCTKNHDHIIFGSRVQAQMNRMVIFALFNHTGWFSNKNFEKI